MTRGVVQAASMLAMLGALPAASAGQLSVPVASGTNRTTVSTGQSAARPPGADVAELARKVAALERRVAELEGAKSVLELRLSALDSKNRTVSLDPSSPRKFQRLDGE